MDLIDTSEVTEVIDIHFSTNGTTAFHGVTPRSLPAVMSTTSSHTLENYALAQTSSDLASSNSQAAATSPINKSLMCSESNSMCSSPFIPVRSNIGKTEISSLGLGFLPLRFPVPSITKYVVFSPRSGEPDVSISISCDITLSVCFHLPRLRNGSYRHIRSYRSYRYSF
jgi:hypothetical protein